MFNIFSKPDPKEIQKENDRALRKVGRDLDREKRELEKQEKKLELEIKKMAKEGNKEGCTILAKQLVVLRKQKIRTYAAGSKVQSIGAQNKAMAANVKLGHAMGTASKALADANRTMRPEKIAADARAFGQAAMKMEMTDDMINDTLDDILAESGDEEESDNIVSQVLDEIGIEISGKMRTAPAVNDQIGTTSKTTLSDADIEAQLAKLKA